MEHAGLLDQEASSLTPPPTDTDSTLLQRPVSALRTLLSGSVGKGLFHLLADKTRCPDVDLCAL